MSRTVKKIIKIPPRVEFTQNINSLRRVAIYARVSTSKEEQLNSIEAQKNFYTEYVSSQPHLVLTEIYADEGISGVVLKKRPRFRQMLLDAENHKFDLIITKSISRFARNTLDTLTCIRKLKALNIEIFFEKENIWTFDTKGEFLITVLSSLAQEESRSISENIKWGIRKKYADGQYWLHPKNFLGYEKGFAINEEQAQLVKLIYRLFLEGNTPYSICNQLNLLQETTPSGKNKLWSTSTICSILQNEKYKGDALLQKKFVLDYLTKKMKNNDGELPKYYVSEGHAPIIPRATFDYVQKKIAERKDIGLHYSCIHPMSGRLRCGVCGGQYRICTGHGDHYWICTNHYSKFHCQSPRLTNTVINQAITNAMTILYNKYSARIKHFLPPETLNFPLTEIAYPKSVVSIILKQVTVNEDYTIDFDFLDDTKVEIDAWEVVKTIAPNTVNRYKMHRYLLN